MKKITSAVVMAALVAGAAFADVNITMNYRTRANMFSFVSQEASKKVSGKTDSNGKATDYTTNNITWFDLDGLAASQDSVGMKVDTEKAGVQLTFMPTATTADGAGWRINTYNAYVKFGDLKIAAGVWKDGLADGAYRVKKDHDASNFEGQFGEVMKLGTGFAKQSSTFVDNMAGHMGGDNNLTGFAEYNLAVNDDMKFNLYAAMVTSEYEGHKTDGEAGDDSETNTRFDTGFVGRVQFSMKDIINAELIYKNPNNKTHTIAFYVMPKMVPGLDLNVGAAFDIVREGGYGYLYGANTYKKHDPTKGDKVIGLDANGNPIYSGAGGKTLDESGDKVKGTRAAYSDDYINWAVDLRARYAINKQLSVWTMNKLYGTTLDAGLKAQKGVCGIDGKAGQLASKTLAMGLWDMVGVRYAINDTFAVLLNGQLEMILDGDTEVDATDKKTEYEFNCVEWAVIPGFQIYATKSANITIACQISGATYDANEKETKTSKGKTTVKKSDKLDGSAISVAIPVVFRVKL